MNETIENEGLLTGNMVQDMQVVFLDTEPLLKLGSSFMSDIFYQCHQRISEEEGVFYFEHHDFFYKDCNSGIVKQLHYGEELIIDSLHILFLGSILCMYALEGDLRVAFRDRRSGRFDYIT